MKPQDYGDWTFVSQVVNDPGFRREIEHWLRGHLSPLLAVAEVGWGKAHVSHWTHGIRVKNLKWHEYETD